MGATRLIGWLDAGRGRGDGGAIPAVFGQPASGNGGCGIGSRQFDCWLSCWCLRDGGRLPNKPEFADRQFGLKERAVTAVEIHDGVLTVPDEIAQEQIADTLAATARVDAKRDLPYHVDRRDWLFIFIAIGLLVHGLFPAQSAANNP